MTAKNMCSISVVSGAVPPLNFCDDFFQLPRINFEKIPSSVVQEDISFLQSATEQLKQKSSFLAKPTWLYMYHAKCNATILCSPEFGQMLVD